MVKQKPRTDQHDKPSSVGRSNKFVSGTNVYPPSSSNVYTRKYSPAPPPFDGIFILMLIRGVRACVELRREREGLFAKREAIRNRHHILFLRWSAFVLGVSNQI